jgi:hypothetical protein
MLASVLLILVANSDAGAPATTALVRALEEVFGSEVQVQIRGVDAPPGDDALARLAGQARGAVFVAWQGAGRDRAALRVMSRAHAPVDRLLTFAASDPPEERGRAVGFVIASILLPAPARPPPPEVQVARPAPPPPVPATVASVAPASNPRWGLEAFGDAAAPLGGHGPGMGVGLGARLQLGARWGVRVGLSARSTTVDEAQASSLELAVAAGLTFTLHRSGAFAVGARVDGLGLRQGLTHFSADDREPVQRARYLPGAAQLLELEWQLAPAAALHGAIGVEEALGTTGVEVRDRRVAEIAVWRAVAEVGVRVRF